MQLAMDHSDSVNLVTLNSISQALVVPFGKQSKIENRLRSELVDVVQVIA